MSDLYTRDISNRVHLPLGKTPISNPKSMLLGLLLSDIYRNACMISCVLTAAIAPAISEYFVLISPTQQETSTSI